MNQGKVNKKFLPREKIIKRPSNLPKLPLEILSDVQNFEIFLEKEENQTAAVSILFHST